MRDDKPRSEVSKQIALALSDEIEDLQTAGIKIIQFDEAVKSITEECLGQSTVIGIGGDHIVGTSYINLLEMFEGDKQT
jgi:hypothetical protein